MDELPEVVVERVSTRGLGANDFGRWLEGWRELERGGWDVTVLAARDNSHAIGLAIRGASCGTASDLRGASGVSHGRKGGRSTP